MKTKRDNTKWLNVAISWGASIVIIGVLFKILHIGGSSANYMIGIGLGVEAFLFFLMGLFPAQKQPDWSKVYPQLDENFKGHIPPGALSGANINTLPSTTMAFDKMLAEADVNPEVLKSLGENLKTFSTKIESITNISDLSNTSNQLNEKMNLAIEKFNKLNADFDKSSAELSAISKVNVDVPSYQEQLTSLTSNLTKLNHVYSQELNSSSDHFSIINQYHEVLKLKMENLAVSANDSEEFSQELKKLNSNLKAMNSVYGNMLNAMKPGV